MSSLIKYLGLLTGTYQLFGLLVVLFVFLYGISVGKTRAIISLLGIFAGYTITSFFPFWDRLVALTGDNMAPFARAGVFLVCYVAAVIVLNLSSLSHRLSAGEISFPKVALISIAQAGLLGGILMSFVPPDQLPSSLSILRPFLSSPLALFLWSIAALIILPFVRSHHRISKVQ